MDTVATERRDMVVEQLFGSTIAALEMMHVHVGRELGLYDTLAAAGPLTADALAARAGIAPRYAREWLEQQACAGLLDVADDTGDAATRTFALPAGVEQALCDPESPWLVAPLAAMLAGVARAVPQVLEAFRTGGGVPYEAYGADVREGIAALNRPMYAHQLASWLEALPDVHERLLRHGGRVADLGCGTGWSTIGIARALPHARVQGVDLDEASVATATARAESEGVSDRVTFTRADAAGAAGEGGYDLVTFFETLHDMAHPVDALRSARALLADDGAVLVADERVAETFTAPGDELERMNYGWSALHCLPAAMTEPDSAAIGTVIRPSTVQGLAAEAGFRACTVLPVEHEFWRFYRLDP